MLAVALLIPSSVFASDGRQLGPGNWDYKGYDDVILRPSSDESKNFKSYGGDFQVRVRNIRNNNSYTISLYEYDPRSGDEWVGDKFFIGKGEGEFEWDVRSAVDGGNGAELYAVISNGDYSEEVRLRFYD